jgi:hypothetical protein
MLKLRFVVSAAAAALGFLFAQASAQAPPPGLRTMDATEINRIIVGHGDTDPGGGTGVQLDLNLMRFDPASFDNPDFFKYFVAMNNCGNPGIDNSLNSEFEYPKIAAFYKDKAPNILNQVPTTVRVQLGNLLLGQYDPARKAFPIASSTTNGSITQSRELMVDHVDPMPMHTALIVCGPASRLLARSGTYIYRIKFDPLKFTEVPVDEATARDWVQSSTGRTVRLLLEVDILPQAPQVMSALHKPTGVIFSGAVKRLVVVTAGSRRTVSLGTGVVTQEAPKELGVLYPQ